MCEYIERGVSVILFRSSHGMIVIRGSLIQVFLFLRELTKKDSYE